LHDNAAEPEHPPGLSSIPDAQQALAAFPEIDSDLTSATAAAAVSEQLNASAR